MTKTLLLAATAVVALFVGGASAGTHPALSGKSQHKFQPVFPHNGLSVLYDQSEADHGVGVVSQNFEPDLDIWDSDAADDFRVTSGQTWSVRQVFARGVYFDGPGPAVSANVIFYADGGGMPGVAVATRSALAIVDDQSGTLTIPLPEPVKLKGGNSRKGRTYWVEVQANMDYQTGGEWGWVTNNTVRGNPSMWRNPGNGFGTKCITFTVMTTCIGAVGEGGDFAFALMGKVK